MALHTIQISRSVKQLATVQVDVPEGQTADTTTELMTQSACNGEFDHLWRDVVIFDVDSSSTALLNKLADDDAKKSLRFTRSSAHAARAMRIEMLRNRYNLLIDPDTCDETEGIRSYPDMACLLADMKHWCDFFKIDFTEIQRLSEIQYQGESAEYRLEKFNKKRL
jgi:hypothetical protein